MKSYIKSFLILNILILMLIGCSKGPDGKSYPWKLKENTWEIYDNGDVVLIIDQESLSTTNCSYTFYNKSKEAVHCGEDYSIQIKIDDVWYVIDKNWDFTAEQFEILPGEEDELTKDWKNWYGELPNGTYRLVHGFFFETEEMENEKQYVAMEFEIK